MMRQFVTSHEGRVHDIAAHNRVCRAVETVAKQAVTDCNHLGNAAKMREALSDACYAMFNFLKTQNGGYEEMAKALDKAKAALSATPRNCDVLSKDEVLRVLDDRSFSKEDTIEWLYDEAKGESNGSK